MIAKLLMQYYTFAELHANTVRENKLVGLAGHLHTEKALVYIYIHWKFLCSDKYVQIKCNCN